MPDFLEKYGSMFMVLGVVIAGFAALVVIMGQHLDAQRQINSQFLQLVTERLDAQDERMDERFEQINQRMNERFELVDQRFEQIDRRFDQVDRRLDRLTDAVTELQRLMSGITERVSRNEGEIDVIREHLRIADTPSP